MRKTVVHTLVLTLSTAILILTVSRLVPHADGTLGDDYRYFLPYLLSGVQWVHQNGWLAIPYFTPDYCGGLPWLANPQSVFYSVPQLLTVTNNPITAVKFTALIFPTIGAAGTYHLMRRCFSASWQASCLAFVLFQLNSFLLFRVLIGHLPYHVFGLIPVLCWLVLLPSAEPRSLRINLESTGGRVVAGGIMLAIMVYAGATNFIIPAILSVASVLLVQHVRSGWRLDPWCVLAGACLWAIPLSALKLLPAFMFIHGYPRSYIPGTLFNDPIRLFEALTASLFVPEILPNFVGPVKGTGTYGRHELEYSVYIVSLLLLLAATVSFILKPARPRHAGALFVLGLVSAVPIALSFSFGTPIWGRLLLKIPILNNNTTFIRWWSIYILLLVVMAGLSFDRVCNERVRDIVLGASVLMVVVQLASRNLSFYEHQGVWAYDPAPVVAAIVRLSQGVPLPEISRVGAPPIPKPRPAADNDALLWGISAYPCYEPIFGYELEMFPAHRLEAGPVNSVIDEHFNLVDPRCYLSLDSGACPAGSLFRSDQRVDVAIFTSHRPLTWQSSSQKFAEQATSVASALSALLLLYLVIESAVRHYRIKPVTT